MALKAIIFVLPSLILWEIWKARNKHFYERVSPSSNNIIVAIMSHIKNLFLLCKLQASILEERSFLEQTFQYRVHPPPHKRISLVSWSVPQQGCYKTYTNGFALGTPGASSCAFVIRGDSGNLVYAECSFLGQSVALYATIQGILVQ